MKVKVDRNVIHHHPNNLTFHKAVILQQVFLFKVPPNASGNLFRPPQFMCNHPYNELIDKLVSMGYRADHVANVIQRLEESGQPVDFNTILDR
ncbi:hypothetical protein ACSBR2_027476 [Camellia fascicularis]